MIPIALSGDKTYNKDTIRRYVFNGSSVIPGSSTIHFDEISKERIYRSIDQIKGINKIIKESYRNLKYKLGRIPNLMDFYENGEVDPLLILSNYKSYYAFLQVVETDTELKPMPTQELTTLEYLSRILPQGKRPHELAILKSIIVEGKANKEAIGTLIRKNYHLEVDPRSIENAIDVLKGTFVSKDEELRKYSCIEILQEEHPGFYERMLSFSMRLKQVEFRNQVADLVELGLKRYEDIYSNSKERRGAFVLYEKYSRRDVCHLLNWGRDLSSTMYGMKRVGDDVAIFVTYHKGNPGEEKQYLEGKPDYADEFINNQIFVWDSQIGKGPDSSYMQDVKEASNKHLFVKKSDAEGTDFYYMGQFDIIDIRADKKKDNNEKLRDISKVRCRMHDIVREDLLDYLQKYERQE